MANEHNKDFNGMLHNNKDMPKMQIICDEKSIGKYGGERMYFAPPIDYDRVMKAVPLRMKATQAAMKKSRKAKGLHMHTKNSLIKDIKGTGIREKGTLLIHSSMKAVGVVEGGGDTVLDAFIDYMKEGLLLFPTHSWSDNNLRDGIYDPKTEPACVGILPNLFMKRAGAVRSMHPTHSVTAMGDRGQAYVLRDSDVCTPCPRNGCFGGLYDEEAQLLFLGATLKTNTFIHSIEELLNIPDRINLQSRKIKLLYQEGDVREIDFYGHYSTRGDVSKNYDKLLIPMIHMGIAKEVKIGDAVSYVVEVKPMTDWVMGLLKENPSLFDDDQTIE